MTTLTQPTAWRLQQILTCLDYLTASARFDPYGDQFGPTGEVVSRAAVILRAPPGADVAERLQGYATRARHRAVRAPRAHAELLP